MSRFPFLIGLAAFAPCALAAFNFGLDEYDVTYLPPAAPSVPVFSDDFNDGLRHDPPTVAFVDAIGLTAEAGGFLVLGDADGFGAHPFLPGLAHDSVTLFQPGFGSIDSGITDVTATYRPDLAAIMSATTLFTGYGIGIQNGDFSAGVFVAVYNTGPSSVWAVYHDHRGLVADVAPILGATGNIVLSLDVDHVRKEAVGSYSTDGGTSFTVLDNGDLFTISGNSEFLSAFGHGANPVPIPPALPLFLSALTGLGFLNRNESKR